MAANRPQKTLADCVPVAVCPALIMALAGSLEGQQMRPAALFHLCCTLALCTTGPAISQGADASKDPKGIRYTIEEISSPALPFQAVRLRFTLRNEGTTTVSLPAVVPAGISGIQGPGQLAFKQPGVFQLPVDIERSHDSSVREMIEANLVLSLAPGEQISRTITYAAFWKNHYRKADGKPLFPVPGEYVLLRYGVSKDEKVVPDEKAITITIHEPRGDDKAVYETLQNDAELASMVMSPIHVADEAMLPKLQDLLERYPKSSYADYVRLALARAYVRWIGVKPRTQRVSHAWTLDALGDTWGMRQDLRNRREVHVHFAYQPQALLIKARAEPIASHAQREAYTHLHRYFTDAIEWQEEFARLVGTEVVAHLVKERVDVDTVWRQFRTQRPESPSAPMREPRRPFPGLILLTLLVVSALTGWWLMRRRSAPVEEKGTRLDSA